MNAKLKQDMRKAGINVSEGDTLAQEDLQSARDFLYFRGIDIGEHFERYEDPGVEASSQEQEEPVNPVQEPNQGETEEEVEAQEEQEQEQEEMPEESEAETEEEQPPEYEGLDTEGVGDPDEEANEEEAE